MNSCLIIAPSEQFEFSPKAQENIYDGGFLGKWLTAKCRQLFASKRLHGRYLIGF